MSLRRTTFACLLALASLARAQTPPALEQQLLGEPPEVLVTAARAEGDPARGALLFFKPNINCARCHDPGSTGQTLGPDLTRSGKDPGVTPAYLVESILAPSKIIKKGYETVTIATDDGQTFTGLLADEKGDAVVLRDPAQDGKLITIPRKQIEAQTNQGPSIMPTGLVNQLADRGQFLDLARYVLEIVEKGPARALELRPDPALLVPPPLPDYERSIDHAGMIAALGPKNFQRGEAIYQRLCINCHGTKDQPGSLPTSRRFASEAFKNGGDPFRMYQTLTQGFGLMPPQTWMVPKQKYDVIHYIREALVQPDNPARYVKVDRAYLDRLPKGDTQGPEPTNPEPWFTMNYGPSLMATIEVGDDASNFAHKGIGVRLDPGPGGIARGRRWAVYDHDTMRMAAAWTGSGFIDWNSIHFNGKHQVHPRVVGRVALANPTGPGWANPDDGGWDDRRTLGRDGRAYGPLPRSWLHYVGLYHHEAQAVLAYTVGRTSVLERPGLDESGAAPVFTRTINLGPRDRDLILQVAHHPTGSARPGRLPSPGAVAFGAEGKATVAAVVPETPGLDWSAEAGNLRLKVPAGAEPLRFEVRTAEVPSPDEVRKLADLLSKPATALDLTPLTRGGPPRWPQPLTTRIAPGKDDGPLAVDVLADPVSNPWFCQLRWTGFDFLPGGRAAAVCNWDGDVWRVEGVDQPAGSLTWRRIASGLFQPLGLKVVDGTIYVTCRDQIVILRDLNGDGETDFYENFNSDHQVTEHFHEFALGLQTDSAGNFYYAKAARHGFPAVVPQHGTLLRVSRDGARTDILATGFRAPNGVCVNDDGTFFVTDQEGFWLPKNRVNWVKPGSFHGNMWGYTDVTDPSDSAMEPPVCWITNAFDRSPGEIVRVSGAAWKPLQGALLNLSYGTGKIFVIPHETVGGIMQGGMCALPIPAFPTGVMRGRFHPGDGQLYACGMFAWAGDRTQPGGFYRVRATGKPIHLPIGLNARPHELALTFSAPLDRASVADPSHYAAKRWGLKRTENYGSPHVNERAVEVQGAALSEDGRTVVLHLPDLEPTWCMEVRYALKGSDGEPVQGVIHNTIHRLGAASPDGAAGR